MTTDINTSKPTKGRKTPYPATTPEAVHAVLAYFNQAVAHLQAPEANPAPDIMGLVAGLPQGSITEARHEVWEQGDVIGFNVKDRKPRYAVPAGFLIVRTLALFGGSPFLDTNKKGGQEQHYVEVLAAGYTAQRLMAGAEPGERVRLIGDHHDLTPQALAIEAGDPRAVRDRRGAIRIALQLYRKNAVKWGLAGIISEAEYEALLRGCFRLFDALHGKHFLRQIGRTAG